MKKFLFALLCVMIFALPSWATNYYVKTGGTDNNNNGGSWENAFQTVTKAVSMAKGTAQASSSNIINIYVAAGTYTGQITLTTGIKLYGGYPAAGGDTRDIANNTTMLKYTSGSVVTCTASDATSSNTVLDGFTITGGTGTEYENFPGESFGGGVYIYNSSPLITNCTITSNTARYGGGIYNSGSPTITNCVFISNSASQRAGGICISNGSPTITNCTFTGNKATDSYGAGGGIYHESGNSTITNCTFTGNKAANSGAEIYNSATLKLINTIVNGATYGTITNIKESYNLVGNPIANWTPVSKTVTVDGVTHTVFTPPAAAIGKGTSTNAPTTDQVGQTRKNPPDIGAYEVPIFYVTKNGNDDNDGQSWANAFATVAHAVDTVSNSGGGSVYVATGEYLQTQTITLKAGVKIYGGFSGSEPTIDLDARDLEKNATTLSRNASSSAAGKFSIITCASADATSSDTILDGFTITGGNGTNYQGDFYGGGVYITAGSPLITNCKITSNTANFGGGFFNRSGNPTITNCVIANNKSKTYNGGGISNNSGSPTITNCTFTNNTAKENGGGFYNNTGSPTITNCTFTGNTATTGAEISNNNGTITLYNSILKGTTDGTITSSDCLYGSALSAWNPTSKNATVKGVTHTVFTPPSAAIGKANTEHAPKYDQLGNLRKAAPDMGALETFWEVKFSLGEKELSAGSEITSGIAGQSYDCEITTDEKFLTVSVDNLPNNISVSSGDKKIKLSGKPLKSGSFDIVITLTSTDNTFSIALGLSIDKAIVEVSADKKATSGRVGIASVVSLDLKASPDIFSYTWSADFSPNDKTLTFNSADKTITGTPKSTDYTVKITAKAPNDAGGTVASASVKIKFDAAVITITSKDITARQGVFYSTTFTAAPSGISYDWTTGSITGGLSSDATTAKNNVLTISGIPSGHETQNISITAKGGGANKTGTYKIKITAGAVFSSGGANHKITDANLLTRLQNIIGVDSDDFLSSDDIKKITSLDLSSADISSLAGLEIFTGLTSLDVSNNKLVSVDLSAFKNLVSLDVSSNDLTSLDVSANTQLKYLNASKNHLAKFNVSANENLERLDASQQILTGNFNGVKIGYAHIISLDVCVSNDGNLKSVAGFSNSKKIISSDYHSDYNAAVIISSDSPQTLTYYYDVDFENYSMDVTLSALSFSEGNLSFASIDIAEKTTSAGENYSSGYSYDISPAILYDYVTASIDAIAPAGAGLTLSNDKILGVPLQATTYTATLGAALAGLTSRPTITADIEITSADVKISAAKITSQTGSAGVAFTANLDLQATPSVFSFDWTVSFDPTPDNLTFNSKDKTITGNPTNARSYKLTFTATAPESAGGLSASQDVTLTVGGAAVSVTRADLTTNTGGTAGVPFESTFDFAASPSYSYSWNVTGFPETLSYSNGKLTGTPLEPGEYTLTARATAPGYAGGTSGTRDVVLTIEPAILSMTYTDAVKISNIGTPYTGIFTATPEILAYDFEVDGLPNGLSHSVNENILTINGTPTTPGEYTITIKATAGGTTKEEIFTLKVSNGIFDDAENFPDANLREKLKEIVSMTEDFFISDETISEITTLDISGAGISDLSGLEKFTALTSLNVSGNNLSNPDFSHFPALTYLDVHNCGLSSLNVSNLSALQYLDCSVNHIREIDLSANTSLNYFDGSAQSLGDTLTGLQLGNIYMFDLAALVNNPENIESVTGAAKFENFMATFTPDAPSAITYNYNAGTSAGMLEVSLSNVDFTTAELEITNAEIFPDTGKVGEEFSSELVSSATPEQIIFEWLIDGLPDGLEFDADEKIISGTPTEAGNFELEIIASAGGMSDSVFVTLMISSADVSPDVEPVSPDNAIISTLEFSSLGRVNENYSATFSISPSENYSWNVENLPGGLTFSGSEDTLIISGIPQEAGIFTLIITAQSENYNGELRISVIISPAETPSDNPSDNPSDEPSDDTSNQTIINVITEILTNGDASSIEEIETIDLSGKNISDLSVVVENLTGLESLDVSGNSIGEIVLTTTENLRSLNCSNNGTTILDVSNSPLLVELDCSSNDLGALNVENNPNLTSLNCADNNLGSLNLQNNSRLVLLGCWNNNLAALDLSNLTELYGLYGFNSISEGENARRPFNASDCAGQKVNGLRVGHSNGHHSVNLGSYVRGGRGAEFSTSENGGDVSRIIASSVKGFDANGNEIAIENYNTNTGEIIFAQSPASVVYDYDTGFNGIKMDVTISGIIDSGEPTDPETPEENNSFVGSKGGGCDFGLGIFALAFVIFAGKKK